MNRLSGPTNDLLIVDGDRPLKNVLTYLPLGDMQKMSQVNKRWKGLTLEAAKLHFTSLTAEMYAFWNRHQNPLMKYPSFAFNHQTFRLYSYKTNKNLKAIALIFFINAFQFAQRMQCAKEEDFPSSPSMRRLEKKYFFSNHAEAGDPVPFSPQLEFDHYFLHIIYLTKILKENEIVRRQAPSLEKDDKLLNLIRKIHRIMMVFHKKSMQYELPSLLFFLKNQVRDFCAQNIQHMSDKTRKTHAVFLLYTLMLKVDFNQALILINEFDEETIKHYAPHLFYRLVVRALFINQIEVATMRITEIPYTHEYFRAGIQHTLQHLLEKKDYAGAIRFLDHIKEHIGFLLDGIPDKDRQVLLKELENYYYLLCKSLIENKEIFRSTVIARITMNLSAEISKPARVYLQQCQIQICIRILKELQDHGYKEEAKKFRERTSLPYVEERATAEED